MSPPMVIWPMALAPPFLIAIINAICASPNRAARRPVAQCKNDARAFIVSESILHALKKVACVTRVAPQRIVVAGFRARR
eukprot:2832221-Pyramimonas_sp.AAC.1